jgi:nucleoside-triphosphatase
MSKGVKIGITGLPESGKTFTLLKVIEMLANENTTIGGMITQPIIKKDVKTGLEILDWMTKKKAALAKIDPEAEAPEDQFIVDITALETLGVQAITRASEEADIIVIDEVGRLEVECEAFVAAVKDALETDKPLILTLHKKSRNPLLQDIRRRDDVRILEVTPINRNLLPYKIMRLMSGEQL